MKYEETETQRMVGMCLCPLFEKPEFSVSQTRGALAPFVRDLMNRFNDPKILEIGVRASSQLTVSDTSQVQVIHEVVVTFTEETTATEVVWGDSEDDYYPVTCFGSGSFSIHRNSELVQTYLGSTDIYVVYGALMGITLAFEESQYRVSVAHG